MCVCVCVGGGGGGGDNVTDVLKYHNVGTRSTD